METKNRIIEEYKKLVKEKKTAIPLASVTSAVLPLRLIISERCLPSIPSMSELCPNQDPEEYSRLYLPFWLRLR